MREVIDLTKRLIEFQSTHHRLDEIRRCADYVADVLTTGQVVIERFETEGYPSIVGTPQPRQTKVLLMSHLDVVEGPDELFHPRERDGRLYGRGSIDDKYAVALSVILIREHVRRARESGKTQADLGFGILVTGDEEIGGFRGAAQVIPLLQCDFCIALDGGSLHEIIMKEKGILRLQLIAEGRSAHGARPWLGDNAIERLMEDCLAVRSLFGGDDPDHWYPTLNIGRIGGGASINQVPDKAEAWLDIRYTENDDVDALLEAIRERVRCQVIVAERDPVFLGTRTPHLDRLMAIAGGVALGRAHGASDARFLAQKGIPGIVWGANGNESQHSLDEHVEVESVLQLYRILDQFVAELTTQSRKRKDGVIS